MKKLLLLVGLVVFLLPSLVNADESDLNNYHCIKGKTKNTNFDAYCFCMYPNGKIFPQRYDNMNLLISTKNTSSCGYDYLYDDENKEISFGIYLKHGGEYKKFHNYSLIEEELTTITNGEIRKWLKEHKKLAKERKEKEEKFKKIAKAKQKELHEHWLRSIVIDGCMDKYTSEKEIEKCVSKGKKGIKNYNIALLEQATKNNQGGPNDPQPQRPQEDQGEQAQAKRKSSDDDWPTYKKKGLNVKGSLTFWSNPYYNKWGQRLK